MTQSEKIYLRSYASKLANERAQWSEHGARFRHEIDTVAFHIEKLLVYMRNDSLADEFMQIYNDHKIDC